MMKVTLALLCLITATSLTHAPAAARCTPRDAFWTSADSSGWVIAEMTGDSARAGEWKRPSGWSSDVAPDQQSREVYGQWGRVVSGDPENSGRALFVHWEPGGDCSNHPPRRAIRYQSGTHVFVGARPRRSARYAAGAPVFDVTAFTPDYDSTIAKMWPGSADRLTPEQYMTWYVGLPTVSDFAASPFFMADKIREWSEFLGFRYRTPVKEALEGMKRELERLKEP